MMWHVLCIVDKTKGEPLGMNNFTPIASSIGGILIGVSAALLLLTHGKIAGISGITGGLMTQPGRGDVAWRWSFLAGLVTAGIVAAALVPGAFAIEIVRSPAALIAAGLLVGFGTRLGNGCTSGHGVCGVSRLSPRSLLATLAFVAAGAIVVFVVRALFGGVL